MPPIRSQGIHLKDVFKMATASVQWLIKSEFRESECEQGEELPEVDLNDSSSLSSSSLSEPSLPIDLNDEGLE